MRFTKRSTVLTVLAMAALALCLANAAHAEPFTVVVLPDTQCYADMRTGDKGLSDRFYAQTEWIRDNKEERNIVMVSHLGDIVQTDFDAEWQIADKAFKTIDGVVPYCLCVGNHDMGYSVEESKCATSRDTLFTKYFPPSRFEANGWRSGRFSDENVNHYGLFEAGGMKFVLLALEFKPRDEVLAWANQVIASHADRRCIVSTHYYLRENANRLNDHGYDVVGNSPEELWQEVVSKHANVFMVLCGHVCAEAHATSVGEHGNAVHEILADYQGWANGGDGYLLILSFDPAEDRIEVKGYSPVLDKYTPAETHYVLDYPMAAQAAKAAAQ